MPLRRKYILAVLLMAALLGAAAASWRLRPHDLLRQATYLTHLDTRDDCYGYVWSSAQEVLLVKDFESALSFNVATRRRTSLPGLSRALEDKPNEFQGTCPASVSPDGKWLLCRKLSSGEYKAYSMDGLHHVLWSSEEIGLSIYTNAVGGAYVNAAGPWLCDGRYWIIDYDTEPSGLSITLASPYEAHEQVIRTRAQIPNTSDDSDPAIVGVTPDNQAIFFSDAPSPMVYAIALSPGATALRSVVALPAGANAVEGILSPQGDRIVWLLDVVDPNKEQSSWLRPVRHWLRLPSPAPVTGLWVSNRDGTKMRLIGTLPLKSGRDPRDILTNPQWTPDGKRVSFISRDALYTVPAD